MFFDVLPAIDLYRGRLARVGSGTVEPVAAFGGDPMAAAEAYRDGGASWVHVVDLDLAFDGRMTIGPIVEALGRMGLRVQASGGVRGPDEVSALLDAGATRVVLGSGALADEPSVSGAIAGFGGSLWCGIEAEGDLIRSRGRDPVELPLVATLGWLTASGAHGFVATAVSKVSGLSGPDVEMIRRVVRTGRPVVAGGGISTIDHLRAVRSAGATGAIVGRAALEGSLDLTEAIQQLD
jgi:phosphoribosylformimino-5-aminoimidazole carboxamide ribonucleotide (ProFAR) isomerase